MDKEIINIKEFLNNKVDLLNELIELKANSIYSKVYEVTYFNSIDVIYNKYEDKYYLINSYGLSNNNFDRFGGFEKLEYLYLYLLNNEFEKDLIELEIINHKNFIKRDYKTDEEKKELRKDLKKFKLKLKELIEINEYLSKYIIN